MKKIPIFLFLIYGCGYCSRPIFTQSKLIERKILDVGENSSPFVVDFNHDGKKDLIVGNKEGEILFYKNIGSDFNPTFGAPTKVAIDTGAIKIASGFSIPVVVQWDRAKDLDLIIGDGFGNIFLAKAINEIIEGNPPTYNSLEKLEADNNEILVGGNAAPYVFDVDEDGLADLLVGDSHGYVWFFKNIGQPTYPFLSSGTKTLVGSQTLDVSQYARPIMIDWDNDGKKDLIVGDIFGNIHIFNPGTQTGTGTFVPNFIFNGKAKVANRDIDVGFYASPIVCNWNNEGGYDMLCGCASGDVSYFLNTKLQESEPPEFNVEQKLGGEKLLEKNERYSKPQVCDFNNDGKKDIIVGGEFGKVKLFLNVGEDNDPAFTDGFTFQITDGTLTQDLDVGNNSAPFPCDFNNDGKKDLVVGNKYGEILVFLNTKTDEAPIFNKGSLTAKVDRENAVPFVYDFNNDGKKDLVVGCDDKNLRLFLNIGQDENPIFNSFTTIDLPLTDERNIAPFVYDWNRDYKKDIIAGMGYGELYVFINSGYEAPVFTDKKQLVFENGNPIKTMGYASPCICDWDNNGSPDLLIGGEDGNLLLSLSHLSNSPPSLVVNTPAGTQSGNINISYTLRDDDFDNCSIEVVFSKDGGFSWSNASSGDGGDGKTGLSSSYIGISHIFVWDSIKDLGKGIYNIILKITPNDGTNVGLPYSTGNFCVNNLLQSPFLPIQVSSKNLDIGAYAVAFCVDWNNDYRKDLLVGDEYGYIMLFLNSGTDENPIFDGGQRIQARQETSTTAMKDLKVVGGFSAPFVTDYNNDGKKDLIVGNGYGYLYYFENIGLDNAPILQKPIRIQGGSDLDVGNRAIPVVIDYNKDGKKDLIVGDEYGYIRLYLNLGSDDNPIFGTPTKLLLGTQNTEIEVFYNSAPCFIDLNANGKTDLVVGDREGWLWVFLNYGDDKTPQYDIGRKIEKFDFGNITPSVVDWDNDGKLDLLLGTRYGYVYLYPLTAFMNTPPSSNILPITTTQMGTIAIKYILYDIDGDTCSIIPEYSLNGNDFKGATGNYKEGLLGSGFGVIYEFLWNSIVDLPDTKTLVYFRITPRDKVLGTSASISFLLDNLNRAPAIKNINLSNDRGLIEISFELFDPDDDPMSVEFSFSLPSSTWTQGAIYGPSSFTSGPCKLYWGSSIDLPETDTICTIKFIPSDPYTLGEPQTKTITIKNASLSSKEVKKDDVGNFGIEKEITFSSTKIGLKEPLEVDAIITIERLSLPSSLSGLSNTGRKISVVKKDNPGASIDTLDATLYIPYNDLFSPDIEKQFVIYYENQAMPSEVDIKNKIVSCHISSPGIYKIDALFLFSDKPLVYPNPCRGNKVTFCTSGRIKIFTLTGQLVKELDIDREWDTKNMDGRPVASGIYIYLVEENNKKGIIAIIR